MDKVTEMKRPLFDIPFEGDPGVVNYLRDNAPDEIDLDIPEHVDWLAQWAQVASIYMHQLSKRITELEAKINKETENLLLEEDPILALRIDEVYPAKLLQQLTDTNNTIITMEAPNPTSREDKISFDYKGERFIFESESLGRRYVNEKVYKLLDRIKE